MVLRELAHAGGPTLQVDGHCRSVLAVQSVRMQSVCILPSDVLRAGATGGF